MKIKTIRFLLLIISIITISTSKIGWADVEWITPPDESTGLYIRSSNGPPGGSPVADDFLVVNDISTDIHTITDIQWWGSYEIDESKYRPDLFSITFWSDDPANNPDVLLKNYMISVTDVNEQQDPGYMVEDRDVYNYNVDISSDPFALDKPDDVYWISIMAIRDPDDPDFFTTLPEWGWVTTDPVNHFDEYAVQGSVGGPPEIGQTWDDWTDPGYTDPHWLNGREVDMAFQLTTTTVPAAVIPEPVGSTLFVIGGATLGFRRFRKKRRTV